MKKLLFIILVLHSSFFTLRSFAQNQRIISHINQVANSMKSLQADFVQTKHMKILGDKMISKGKMYYQQANKLHWEYTSPYTYTFILNGDKVLLKKNDRKDVIDVNKNRMFREIAQIMMHSVVGKCLTDSKNFTVSLEETTAAYIATLIPQKKEMKAIYNKIVLTFNKKSCMISKVLMYEKKGDTTEIQLKNVTTNTNFPAAIFAVQ